MFIIYLYIYNHIHTDTGWALVPELTSPVFPCFSPTCQLETSGFPGQQLLVASRIHRRLQLVTGPFLTWATPDYRLRGQTRFNPVVSKYQGFMDNNNYYDIQYNIRHIRGIDPFPYPQFVKSHHWLTIHQPVLNMPKSLPPNMPTSWRVPHLVVYPS